MLLLVVLQILWHIKLVENRIKGLVHILPIKIACIIAKQFTKKQKILARHITSYHGATMYSASFSGDARKKMINAKDKNSISNIFLKLKFKVVFDDILKRITGMQKKTLRNLEFLGFR